MRENKVIDRNYGSIPHLSISKLSQQADKKIQIGQEIILTKKARDWKDTIIVTEKLDGSNVGVIKNDGVLRAITRKGYDAKTSPYSQHHYFDKWVQNNLEKFEWLPEGYRVCGEWMLLTHGTKYDITYGSPFVAFDLISDKNERFSYVEMLKILSFYHIQTVTLVHIGQPISIKNSLSLLGQLVFTVAGEKPEGVVYRCEREGRVDFLAKYVRADKIDGEYLGAKEVWNKGTEKYMIR